MKNKALEPEGDAAENQNTSQHNSTECFLHFGKEGSETQRLRDCYEWLQAGACVHEVDQNPTVSWSIQVFDCAEFTRVMQQQLMLSQVKGPATCCTHAEHITDQSTLCTSEVILLGEFSHMICMIFANLGLFPHLLASSLAVGVS